MDFGPFEVPNWRAPLDTQAVLASVPTDVSAKGMFHAQLQDELEREGFARGPDELAEKKYGAYRDYPMHELMRIELFAIEKLYPGVPSRAALRSLGRSAYRTFAESLVGRVIFGALGNNPAAIVKVASKGYRRTMSHGRGKSVFSDDTHAIVHLEDIYNFPDSYQIGVMEGGLDYLGYDAEVRLSVRSPTEVFVRLEWHRRAKD